MNLIFSFIVSLVFYLALTFGSGSILYWSREEIVLGVILSALTGIIAQRIFKPLKIGISPKLLNPLRWVLFLVYLFVPFLISVVKANLEVAYRIITNRIKPGIVKISPDLKTDLGLTLLANSITLTPGTLSVDLDQEKNLYVHCLWVKDKKPGAKPLAFKAAKWIKIITE
jgi:multicomponent Na+:H+ antiporter subunit E